MNLVELRGIEKRSYEKDGQQRQFVGLHVSWQDWDGKEDSFIGERCENFSCPRGVDANSLQVGELYEVKYEIYQTKTGKGARVCDLVPVPVK